MGRRFLQEGWVKRERQFRGDKEKDGVAGIKGGVTTGPDS